MDLCDVKEVFVRKLRIKANPAMHYCKIAWLRKINFTAAPKAPPFGAAATITWVDAMCFKNVEIVSRVTAINKMSVNP